MKIYITARKVLLFTSFGIILAVFGGTSISRRIPIKVIETKYIYKDQISPCRESSFNAREYTSIYCESNQYMKTVGDGWFRCLCGSPPKDR